MLKNGSDVARTALHLAAVGAAFITGIVVGAALRVERADLGHVFNDHGKCERCGLTSDDVAANEQVCL